MISQRSGVPGCLSYERLLTPGHPFGRDKPISRKDKSPPRAGLVTCGSPATRVYILHLTATVKLMEARRIPPRTRSVSSRASIAGTQQQVATPRKLNMAHYSPSFSHEHVRKLMLIVHIIVAQYDPVSTRCAPNWDLG